MVHGDGPTGLRAAVVGCGAIAHEHLAFLSASSRAQLNAVCDTSPATADFARERYGAASSFTDAGTMLGKIQPDVVHILTPPHTHPELAYKCIDAGAHVVCEKPLAPSAAVAEQILEHATAAGRIVVESRNILFNDPVVSIDRLVRSGRLGVIREVDIQLSLDLTAGPFGDLNLIGPGVELPGGAVHDFLPHLAYLFLHFVGHAGAIDQVVGTLRNDSGNRHVGYDHLDAIVTVGSSRGHLRVVSDVQPDMFRLWVRGDAGSAEGDLYNPYVRVEGRRTGKRAPLEHIVNGMTLAVAGMANFRDKLLQHGSYHGLHRMLDQVYDSVGRGISPVSDEDILSTARLVDRLVALRTEAE